MEQLRFSPGHQGPLVSQLRWRAPEEIWDVTDEATGAVEIPTSTSSMNYPGMWILDNK